MKTITKSEQLLELSEGAVILTSDGIPAQLVMNQATYRRDGGGRYHWQRTDGTYLTHTFSALLPAALLYPLGVMLRTCMLQPVRRPQQTGTANCTPVRQRLLPAQCWAPSGAWSSYEWRHRRADRLLHVWR